jgi:3-hydroxybutyryl-CoA dehydrogenase
VHDARHPAGVSDAEGLRPAALLGVVGAGTMGSLIAALGCVAGRDTLLFDPIPEALEQGIERARKELAGGAERGRWDAGLEAKLRPAGKLEDLRDCEIVIEAAPERLDLKHELFTALREVAPEAILATNTSSIPVTKVGGTDERVVGMHFFNPPTRMKLVEVIAGEASSEDALEAIRRLGRDMGKRVIDAADGPGFLVNRCNRPFGLEALRLLQDRIADVETIDRIVRLEGGFRMGPFELQDLVGIDTGFEVSKSFYELSFYEPRWRPSPLSERMVAAGKHGRKTGQGWYAYPPGRPEDPPAPEAGGGDGAKVTFAGNLPLTGELAALARDAGYDVTEDADKPGPALVLPDGSRALLVAAGSLARLDAQHGAVGFHALPPLAPGGLVEVTRTDTTDGVVVREAERFFQSLGLHTAAVGDAPGLVLGRMVAQVINESFFALGEGVGNEADIDDGMVLGMNHPRGPFAWAEAIGLKHVLAILDALHGELGEERYRAAPELRRRVDLTHSA